MTLPELKAIRAKDFENALDLCRLVRCLPTSQFCAEHTGSGLSTITARPNLAESSISHERHTREISPNTREAAASFGKQLTCGLEFITDIWV